MTMKKAPSQYKKRVLSKLDLTINCTNDLEVNNHKKPNAIYKVMIINVLILFLEELFSLSKLLSCLIIIASP